eukprot:m.228719 g.228719  ORF g.228719 m.228719 type:complete len:67 (+) comp17051_c0_seq46:993-1193(+)
MRKLYRQREYEWKQQEALQRKQEHQETQEREAFFRRLYLAVKNGDVCLGAKAMVVAVNQFILSGLT